MDVATVEGSGAVPGDRRSRDGQGQNNEPNKRTGRTAWGRRCSSPTPGGSLSCRRAGCRGFRQSGRRCRVTAGNNSRASARGADVRRGMAGRQEGSRTPGSRTGKIRPSSGAGTSRSALLQRPPLTHSPKEKPTWQTMTTRMMQEAPASAGSPAPWRFPLQGCVLRLGAAGLRVCSPSVGPHHAGVHFDRCRRNASDLPARPA
jgi:hypothetical protein